MRNEGMSPDVFTYTSVLKACGITGCLEIGEEIHAEIDKQGLLAKSIMLGTSLVGMYAKCGFLEKARKLLQELPVRDAVSWSTLISEYSQCGLGNEALSCFEEMRNEGIPADAVTYACVLKACGSTGSRKMGEAMHAEIREQRLLEKDIVLGNVLVDMYAKLGMLGKAEEVFDELPVKDVVSWSSLITGYAQQGLGSKALNCFRQMQADGISPSLVTFGCILKACGSTRSLEIGEEIHAEIEKRGFSGRDIAVRTSLVDMYAKCGVMEKAKKVFEEIVARDAVAYNALMAGYVEQGRSDEVLEWFKRMQDEGIPPDAITFASILKSCGGTRYSRIGIEIHAKILKKGLLEDDIVLSTALVDMYAKGGMVDEAREVFEKLSKRDLVCWNALMSGYAQQGLLEEASNCLKQMHDEAISPDAFTFACIVRACGNAESLETGQQIHKEVHKLGLLEKDLVLNTALVDMYIKCGVLGKALEVFELLQVHDVIAWRTLISGYAQHGLADEAFSFFRQMKDNGLIPDATIFICILKLCSCTGSLGVGEAVHDDVNKQGLLEQDAVLATTLVDMYTKCGALVKAHEVFDRIHSHDVVSWNSLMAGYAQLGQARTVLNSLPKMVSEGIEPDLLTFHVLLLACSHAGLVREGQILFYCLSSHHSRFPATEHYTCMVDLLSRAGLFEEAKDFVGRVNAADRLPLLMSLLGACQKWLDVEVARWVFSQTLELDETCSLAYVCMANIYAAAGMHARAGKSNIFPIEE
jgi:pentatricopeptide repeat protein